MRAGDEIVAENVALSGKLISALLSVTPARGSARTGAAEPQSIKVAPTNARKLLFTLSTVVLQEYITPQAEAGRPAQHGRDGIILCS
jgi:hypothetical protein